MNEQLVACQKEHAVVSKKNSPQIVEVVIKWSEKNQKWLMFKDGYFVYDFWDCENFNRMFEGLEKDRLTKFQLLTRKISTL